MRKLSVMLAGATALALSLSACGGNGDDAETEAAGGMSLVNEGQLTVCSDIPYEPFEMEDEGGGYTGFDIDLMTEIAAGMDLELSVQDSGFDALQSGAALAAGQCDIAASAMTITEERDENLDFSDPYYDSLQSLLVPAGSDITSIEDLAGTQVGVQQGTTGKAYAEENAPEDAQLIDYPSDAELYTAIQAGNVEAVLQDLPVNITHTQDGEYEIVEEYDTEEQYGFAVAEEGSEELLEQVNTQLQELRDNGTYDELYEQYFSTE
ncbi:MAG TPA: transporter substrate-binding domain-containing protein [Jiangellaceae bacterium]|nr:transporter substrate-binding domain-containing protein [Jiangellaceae bacterium]